MNVLREMIVARDKRLLPLLVILLFGLSLSIYKMVDAFTGDHSNPSYASNPSAAFAVQAPDTLIEPAATEQPRLPDDAYATLLADAKKISSQAAQFQLTAAALQADGMSSADATSATAALDSLHLQVEGATGQIDQPQIGTVTSTSVSLSTAVTYRLAAGTPLSVIINTQYGLKGADSTLQSLTVNTGSLAPTTPTQSTGSLAPTTPTQSTDTTTTTP
jgi:hypothetical protein